MSLAFQTQIYVWLDKVERIPSLRFWRWRAGSLTKPLFWDWSTSRSRMQRMRRAINSCLVCVWLPFGLSTQEPRPNAMSGNNESRNESGGSNLEDRQRTTPVSEGFSSYQRGWAEVGQHNLISSIPENDYSHKFCEMFFLNPCFSNFPTISMNFDKFKHIGHIKFHY